MEDVFVNKVANKIVYFAHHTGAVLICIFLSILYAGIFKATLKAMALGLK
jgi:hypothetical protein